MLAEYPPYHAPYPGRGRSLTVGQAEANLAFLLEHKQRRLQNARELLRPFGLDLDAGLGAHDPRPFLDGLWRWSVAEWPGIYYPDDVASLETWLDSTRDGPQIVYSMLMDVAIVLAEVLLVRRSDFRWALDLDPENEAMASWRRPVVLRAADAVVPAILFDFEDTARTCYASCTKPSYGVVNDLGREVIDTLSGAYEAAWHAETRGRQFAADAVGGIGDEQGAVD